MDAVNKFEQIATQMDLEIAEEVRPPSAPCGVPLTGQGAHSSLGVAAAQLSGGRPLRLLKTMLTTACERNCFYCPFRAGRKYRRVNFKPEEMARSFDEMQRKRIADGLFLSSGILRGGVTTQDKLIDTVDILRNRYNFRGYVHLKIMPGAERAQVERAMQLADRISVNLEAPTTAALHELAPMKQLVDELLRPLKWAEEIRRSQRPFGSYSGRWPSSVTQFVVGATDSGDLDFLRATEYLYRSAGLRRTYYSAFRPVSDTPLQNRAPENPLREHRLYQASFLLRDYGFELEDMPFDERQRLPLDVDPKLAWAQRHLQQQPVELNRAQREQLLRVPGIGPVAADKIIAQRRLGRLRDESDLRRLGVRVEPLRDYVLLDGSRPGRQLRLF